MAKALSAGYADTTIPNVSSLNFSRGLINFDKDWKIQSNTAGECVLTNLKAPLDRPETISIRWTEKSNVYQTSGIDPSVRPPSQRGVSFVINHKRILTCTDTADANFRHDVPVHAHTVIQFPLHDLLTADMIQSELGRLVSAMYDTGALTTTRLSAIMRGVVAPSITG